jgi:predicted naringenin-chalcone synthase
MNSGPKIISTAIAVPELRKTNEESRQHAEVWLAGQDDRLRRKALRIFQYAEVDQRFTVTAPEDMIRFDSFEARNDHYIQSAIKLSGVALEKALERASVDPAELDYIVTVSCTGFMIPSVDAYLINQFGMRQDIVRLPVTEMGCAAGVSALIYVKQLLANQPGKKAAVIAAEFPSCTFQADDFSMANIVSTALFGDGVACAIVAHDPEREGAELGPSGMYHFYDAIHMMGYRVVDSGFQMVLDPQVPETIAGHMPAVLDEFLEKHGWSISELKHFVFHPGGKKIMRLVEELLDPLGKNIDATKEVFRTYGNMSSATVLYVLDHLTRGGVKAGDKGMMLSFGPGFSAQRILLTWS